MRHRLGLALLAGFFFGAELFGSQAAVALFLGLPASTGFGLGCTAGQLGLVLLAFGAAAFVGTCWHRVSPSASAAVPRWCPLRC